MNNVHALEVMGRDSESQLQVRGQINYKKIF